MQGFFLLKQSSYPQRLFQRLRINADTKGYKHVLIATDGKKTISQISDNTCNPDGVRLPVAAPQKQANSIQPQAPGADAPPKASSNGSGDGTNRRTAGFLGKQCAKFSLANVCKQMFKTLACRRILLINPYYALDKRYEAFKGHSLPASRNPSCG